MDRMQEERRADVVLSRTTWELLLTKMVSATVDRMSAACADNIGKGEEDIKRMVRGFLPRIPFQPVQLDRKFTDVFRFSDDVARSFPEIGHTFQSGLVGSAIGCSRWAIWPGSCPRTSQDYEVDLTKAGIVQLEDDGRGTYEVVDRIPFKDFPKRFALEDSDHLQYLERRYEYYRFDYHTVANGSDHSSVRAPNYRHCEFVGETMGYEEGSSLDMFMIDETWFSVAIGSWETLNPADNSLETLFSVVPRPMPENLGLVANESIDASC